MTTSPKTSSIGTSPRSCTSTEHKGYGDDEGEREEILEREEDADLLLGGH